MPPLLVLVRLEVMDKEPSILAIWVAALVLGGVGYRLAHRRWWWVLPLLLLLAASFAGLWAEWTDPLVGAAIAAEAGRQYPAHLLAATALAAGLIVAGLIRTKRAA